MLPEALIARGKSLDALEGYTLKKTRHVLRISVNGEFRSLTDERRTSRLPTMPRSANIVPYTGMDTYGYTLCVGRPDRDLDYAQDRHEAYKEMLSLADSDEARAILAFLASPNRPVIVPVDPKITDEGRKRLIENAKSAHHDPDNAEVLIVPDSCDSVLYIEVGEDPSWHMKPHWQKYHKARLNAQNTKKGEVRGTCSLCLEEAILARTFPKGVLKPVTFNAKAWESYGKSQAYNAPTCTSCAHLFMSGLNSIVSTKGSRRVVDDKWFLWWSDNHEDPPLFDLLDTILDKEVSDGDRSEALDAITDGHFAVIEKMQGRAAVQRYFETSAEKVKANIRRWMDSIGPRGLWEMGHVLKDSVPAVKHPNAYMMVCLDLIADVRLPPAMLQRSRNLSIKDGADRRLTPLLDYLQAPTPPDLHLPLSESMDDFNLPDNLNPLSQCAFLYGVAFGRAERNQRLASNPNRTIRDTSFDRASKHPFECSRVCERHHKAGSRYGADKMLQDLLSAASDAFLKAGCPETFNAQTQQFFHMGYRAYRSYQIQKNESYDSNSNSNSDSE